MQQTAQWSAKKYTLTYDNNGGSSAVINDVVFDSNGAADAGAVWAWDNVDISNCDFTNNVATGTGGAIVFTSYCSSSSLTDSNFTGNTATEGNAVYNNQGNIDLSGNDVSKTSADIVNVNGGKITSTIKIVVLDGEVKTINTFDVDLYALLVVFL